MTKSRIALIALAIGCIAMLGAGTAAYFTVQDTAYNVITTGLLDMTLQEVTADGAPEGTPLDQLPPFEDAFGVMPGQEISKIVFVENTGTADFYIAVVGISNAIYRKFGIISHKCNGSLQCFSVLSLFNCR